MGDFLCSPAASSQISFSSSYLFLLGCCCWPPTRVDDLQKKMKFSKKKDWKWDEDEQKRRKEKMILWTFPHLRRRISINYTLGSPEMSMNTLYYQEVFRPPKLPDSFIVSNEKHRERERDENLFCEKWNYNKAAHVAHIRSRVCSGVV